MKIGLLDHLGHGNLGDDATLDAVMHNIKARWPHAAIIGLSLNPHDTEQRHGIPSYAIRRDSKAPPKSHNHINTGLPLKAKIKIIIGKHRLFLTLLSALNLLAVRGPQRFLQELMFLLHSLRITRSLDLLIICGGGQLLDSWGGPWSFPYTVFKWVVLAKLARAKCYIINVGAGPLRHRLSHYLIQRALSLADYTSFRDVNSRLLAQQLGFSGPSQVFPDSVYSLDVSTFCVDHPYDSGRDERLVGIAPMAYCDPRRYWEKDQIAYDRLINALALFGSRLLQDHQYRLTLFSTDIHFDAQAIEELKALLTPDSSIFPPEWLTHEPVRGVEALLSQMSQMDFVVTCRFHGVIFAHILNKPVIALSHHEKVHTLMKDIGLAEYCVDARTVDAENLFTAFQRLIVNHETIKARMAVTADYYKRRLKSQFDELFNVPGS
jgi:polysaccharide pyruvyl transferase WcaK-like protein